MSVVTGVCEEVKVSCTAFCHTAGARMQVQSAAPQARPCDPGTKPPGVCSQLNKTSKTMEYSGKVGTSLPQLQHSMDFRPGF